MAATKKKSGCMTQIMALLLSFGLLGSCFGGNSLDAETTQPANNETIGIVSTQQSTEKTEKPDLDVPEPTQKPTEAPQQTEKVTEPTAPKEPMVWIPTNGGSKYHCKKNCSGMEDPQQVPLSKAESMGYTKCKRCY